MLCFFLKLIAYLRPFGEGVGVYFPQMWSTIVLTPKKDHPCAEIRHKAWKLVQRFDLQGAGSRRIGKDRTGQSKKARSCKISPIWGEAPTVPIETKICMAGNLPMSSRMQSIKIMFLGVRFYRGSNSPFSYWFSHGPYNSAALTALPVIKHCLVLSPYSTVSTVSLDRNIHHPSIKLDCVSRVCFSTVRLMTGAKQWSPVHTDRRCLCLGRRTGKWRRCLCRFPESPCCSSAAHNHTEQPHLHTKRITQLLVSND